MWLCQAPSTCMCWTQRPNELPFHTCVYLCIQLHLKQLLSLPIPSSWTHTMPLLSGGMWGDGCQLPLPPTKAALTAQPFHSASVLASTAQPGMHCKRKLPSGMHGERALEWVVTGRGLEPGVKLGSLLGELQDFPPVITTTNFLCSALAYFR